jgi:CDGSH-type Zn-finger protein
MDQPEIAQKSPCSLELASGTYWWCACGRSKTQPFCDGSHKGSAFSPLKLEIAQTTLVALCCCKHSQNKPFCDGSHNKL